MRILGIETSCDETAAAVVEDGTKILSSVIASSQEIHKKYGGIIPEQAAREQLKSMIPVLNETLRLRSGQVDAIAVTVGPGLIGSLLIGVETARTLAWLWNKPIIPINHLIAHIYGNYLSKSKIYFPAICLVVSGGHTELVLMKSHGQFRWIGGTRDDAAGECFDKCARLLDLGYPGGPAIATAADKSEIRNQKSETKLPRPMIGQDNFDFSFSGLKTAVINQIKTMKPHFAKATRGKQFPNQLAYEIQEAITDVLVAKTLKAAQHFKVKSILVGGGVAANKRLRAKFKIQNSKFKIFIPEPKLCTDNAAIIACAAFFNYNPIPWQKIKANPGLEI